MQKNNFDRVILAIDTSNYTTSVAILDLSGELVANLKLPLKVNEGARGLRQSDALFSHTVNLPEILHTAEKYLNGKEIAAIGVSDKPRNVEGSYMPCFLAGVASAESISCTGRIPLYRFSHQCGHIMAALYSSGATHLLEREFAAFHISGGTTELVRVAPDAKGFKTELLGGTLDLNAGQLIDRIGVYMGLRFPAGPEMEKLALLNDKKIPSRRIRLNEMSVNLSGIENLAIKLYEETKDKALCSAFVFNCVSSAIIAISEEYEKRYGKCDFVYAGGVMSNSIIKSALRTRFSSYFAEPSMSADNAVGIAALTLRAYKSENR